MTHGGSSSHAKPCPTLTHKFSSMYQMLKQNVTCKHECKRPAAVAVAGLLVVVAAAVEQQLAVVVVAAAAAAVASAGCGYS